MKLLHEMYSDQYSHVVKLFEQAMKNDKAYCSKLNTAVDTLHKLAATEETIHSINLFDEIDNMDIEFGDLESLGSIATLTFPTEGKSLNGVIKNEDNHKDISEHIADMSINYYAKARKQLLKQLKKDVNMIRAFNQEEALKYIQNLMNNISMEEE